MRNYYATVTWYPSDVQGAANSDDIAAAEEWLVRNEGDIKDAMETAGWDAIEMMLKLDPLP